jgi:site-specific DNA-adenine methylase
MKPLKPFFSYFGSKYRLSKKYKTPSKDILIEPFAGSACYSLHYPEKQVKLYDKYDVICGVWDYLIHANEKEILDLPLIDFDKTLDDYSSLSQESKWLIGFWLAKARTTPTNKMSSYSTERFEIDHADSWNPATKRRIASQLRYIRHWTIEQKSYEQIENEDATWFIDPPYQQAGKSYKESSKNIDFDNLGGWCKERSGEIIVCENLGATWLPFQEFSTLVNSKSKVTHEVVYYQGFDNETTQLTLF